MEDLTQYRLRKLEEKMDKFDEVNYKVSNLEGKVTILITINAFALLGILATLIKLFSK